MYLRLPQQTKQLSPLNKIHHHVQVLAILPRAPQRDQEGVATALQHPPLVIRVLDLLHLDHLRFLQHFDGVEALVVFALY